MTHALAVLLGVVLGAILGGALMIQTTKATIAQYQTQLAEAAARPSTTSQQPNAHAVYCQQLATIATGTTGTAFGAKQDFDRNCKG